MINYFIQIAFKANEHYYNNIYLDGNKMYMY